MKKRTFPIRLLLVFSTFMLTVLLYIDRALSRRPGRRSLAISISISPISGGSWPYSPLDMHCSRLPPENGLIRRPRRVITSIVGIWSLLTALTGAAWNFGSMLVIRFLFGAGEAGAFPSLTKVVYNWFPVKERGIVQGINFSGSRIDAAFALPLLAGAVGTGFPVSW